MALITEDGSIVAGAESYCSVSDADAYHAARNNAAWASAATAYKEAALRAATAYLDTTYRWNGDRVSMAQALYWPRVSVWVDGYDVPSDKIPQSLVHACAELALRALTAPLFSDAESQYVEEVQVGPIKRKLSAPRRGDQRRFSVADALVRDLASGGGHGAIRLVRA